jgi:membrane protein insertase Oxa1/YidC/SpoIIIJ
MSNEYGEKVKSWAEGNKEVIIVISIIVVLFVLSILINKHYWKRYSNYPSMSNIETRLQTLEDAVLRTQPVATITRKNKLYRK